MNRYIITFFLMIQQLFSIGVSAGTEIKHIAYLDYVVESIPMETRSNELIEIVDQKLDMTMVSQEGSSVIVDPGDIKVRMSFKLTNNGNGEDSYTLTPIKDGSSNFSVSNIEIYQDNGDGVFSVTEDKIVNKVKLLADESATLFFVANIPKDATKISLNGIQVDSIIQGDLVYGEIRELKNFYAVVATTDKSRKAFCAYEVPSLVLELDKTSTLSSAELYKGSIIHYDIGVKAIGTGSVENIVVRDEIPTGTTYLKNSLKLDGRLIDGFDGKSIAVEIGSIEQKKESNKVLHHVTFDVKVQ